MQSPSRGADRSKYCVVGGGIIGSWTALQLRRAGVPVVLFEQFPLPHTRGSSHGGSRVIRLLGDDNLAALEYSFQEWKKLQDTFGQQLLVQTGLINLGTANDAYLEKYKNIVLSGGYPCESLDAKQLQSRYPMIRYGDEIGAVSDPSGSILLAHTCVLAVQREFERLGGLLVTGQVQSLEPCSDGVKVKVKFLGGDIEDQLFQKVAVCAGPWSKRLLPRCAHLLSSQAIPVTYWREIAPPGQEYVHSVAAKFPVIFNARMANIYAIPSYEYPGLMKVLVHSAPDSDPEARDHVNLQPTVDYIASYIKKHLPRLDSNAPAIRETCMYTMTPDSKPLIDLYHPNIAVGTGYSGSGFKHSPASGKMVASLLLGTANELAEGFNLQKYRISRFQDGTTHSLADSGRFVHPSGRI